MLLSDTYNFVVLQEYHGLRLDKFIVMNIADISRSKIKQLIEDGNVNVNNQIIKAASYLIKSNEIVIISIPPPTQSILVATNIPLEIIFEDDDLLIINKPIGLTVHSGAGTADDTLVNGLMYYCGDKLSNIDATRPGIVHRLDKDTSGLMVVAKTNKTHNTLSKNLAARKIKRTYLTLVYGQPTPKLGTIQTFYGRSKQDRTKWTVLRMGGKMAVTHYQVLETFGMNALSLVECTLETGRTHQIRVHLTHKGHPIIGDQTYGRDKNFNLNSLPIEAKTLIKNLKRQALHAYKLAFSHPITKEELSFEADLPEDMNSILGALKL